MAEWRDSDANGTGNTASHCKYSAVRLSSPNRGQFSLPVNQWFGKEYFTGKRLFTGKLTEVFTSMHDFLLGMKKVRSD